MAWIWAAIIVAAILYLVHQWRNPATKKKLPPGPKGLPIIGHFHLLSKNSPHHDLHRLAQKYGPLMYMRFGPTPTIIISSPAAAELVLKTYDHIFADRSHHEAGHYLSYEQRDIVYGRYSTYWRNMRKLCTLQLLSSAKIAQFEPMRKAEAVILVDELREAAAAREVVDLSVRVTSAIADMTCLMVFGRKFGERGLDERGFKEVMKETMEAASALNLGEHFPYLRWLDLQGTTRQLKRLSKTFDTFLDRIIDDHVRDKDKRDKGSHDFVDTIMSIHDSGEAGFEFDRRHVKAVLLDMLIAGIDTSATAVEWALSDLLKHPTVMKRLQKEIDETAGVGPNQMVEESHLSTLTYLDCVIKESMRLHPVGAILPHHAMEDCEVNGFHIPKDARILVNVWAVGRDPDAWVDPESFIPDRFLDSSVDLRGRDFQLIPFGSGRRGCLGINLGLATVRLMVARLVHCFDFELPDGMAPSELDMSEHFGVVTSRANHLRVIPTYRLTP